MIFSKQWIQNNFLCWFTIAFWWKKNTVQAQQWLEKCYGDSAPSKTTICRWYAEFKRGRTDTDDAERSGRPNEVRLLTADQKRQHVVDSERCLELFRRNKPNFLCRYVTMDETWIHHYTLRSQSGRQPSGLQSVRRVQSGQKRKCGPVRLWPQYFGMLMEFCSSTSLKKVRRSIANVTWTNLNGKLHKYMTVFSREHNWFILSVAVITFLFNLSQIIKFSD